MTDQGAPHRVVRNPLPQLHIRPDHGWLNDPNGMVWHRGRWHVFYQHNPSRPVHQDIAWGHVSSKDLVEWAPHPLAFAPTPDGPDQAGCWSGVYLPWLDRPAMVYSGVVDDTFESTVCVREALDDDLDHFGPAYVVAETPDDVTQMRDPFCFEWQGRRLALVGARIGEATSAVLLYSCDDPRRWRYEGVWLSAGEPGTDELRASDIWECPQLIEVDGRWILLLSLQIQGRLSTVEYLLGNLVDGGGLPRFRPTGSGRLDDGTHCYAPQVASDPDGPWLLGWVTDTDKWRASAPAVSGCLTLPRRLSLAGDQVVSQVDPGLLAYAVAQPADHGSAREGLDLPAQAYVHGTAAQIRLVGADTTVEIPCPTGGFEIWTDGEVVEVYRPEDASYTLRQPGTSTWRLVADADVAVSPVAPPSREPPGDTPAFDEPARSS